MCIRDSQSIVSGYTVIGFLDPQKNPQIAMVRNIDFPTLENLLAEKHVLFADCSSGTPVLGNTEALTIRKFIAQANQSYVSCPSYRIFGEKDCVFDNRFSVASPEDTKFLNRVGIDCESLQQLWSESGFSIKRFVELVRSFEEEDQKFSTISSSNNDSNDNKHVDFDLASNDIHFYQPTPHKLQYACYSTLCEARGVCVMCECSGSECSCDFTKASPAKTKTIDVRIIRKPK